jgi:hypothetical protein
MRLNDLVLQLIPLPIINYTNCIYFLVHLKNKYAMVSADTT